MLCKDSGPSLVTLRVDRVCPKLETSCDTLRDDLKSEVTHDYICLYTLRDGLKGRKNLANLDAQHSNLGFKVALMCREDFGIKFLCACHVMCVW